MMYAPKGFIAVASMEVKMSDVVELVVEPTPIRVYFRRNDGKLGQINAAALEHEDAILAVKESMVANNQGWNAPVLAVINGGRNEQRNYA